MIDEHFWCVSLRIDELEEVDSSEVVKTELADGRDYFRVEQESGNWFELPWDDVLYHCEPSYEYYKGNHGSEPAEDTATRIPRHVMQL